jgi:hypothetical protein
MTFSTTLVGFYFSIFLEIALWWLKNQNLSESPPKILWNTLDAPWCSIRITR